MAQLFTLPLAIDAHLDFRAIVSCVGQDYTPIAVTGATAALEVRGSALDPTPLLTVSTTPSSSGGIVMGVALPPPAGASCSTLAAVDEHQYPGSVSTVPPLANQGAVANLTALGLLVTTGFLEGDVVAVTIAPGTFFQWSPGDTRTPDGSTIVAGHGGTGNWCLCGTFTLVLTAAALAAVAGFDHAVYDLVVTWGDGTKTKFLGKDVWIDQTETL